MDIENVRYTALQTLSAGMTVVIEANSPRDVSDFMLTCQQDVQALRNHVGTANLKVQMRFSHRQNVQENSSLTFRRVFSGVGDGLRAGISERRVGKFNCSGIFAPVDKLGYDG